MSGRLAGKVCVITGTGGSIGQATAWLFAKEGAHVVGCDLDPSAAEATLAEVRSKGGSMVSMHPCDLTNPESCRELVDLAIRSHGRIDVLYNNAAMAYFSPFSSMPDSVWHSTINEELHLVFNLTRAAWEYLGRQGGSVISTASTAGWIGMRELDSTAHAAAKGAIIAMTRQLAAEGAPLGIRVNSISPGVIETKQTLELLKDADWATTVLGRHMLKRAGKPHEIAYAALFLASDESSFITGSDIKADGGLVAG